MNANQIRKKVLASGESREQIAYKANVSYSWLSKFALNVIKNPRQSTLDKLESYFKVRA